MKKITLLCSLIFVLNIYSQTQLLSSIEEVDIGGGTWMNVNGSNYTYENNNLKTETDFFWNGINWEESGKTTYTYNVNNKATLEVYQSYNSSTSMYENEERIEYTYNGNGDLVSIEGFTWETGAWVAESRSTIMYSGTTLTSGFSEDYNGSVWVNTFQSTLYRNGNGTIDEIIEEEWNGSAWVLDGRDTFTYNGSNISSVKYDERNGAVWEESFTTTYVLDGNGNRTSETDTFVGGGSPETITYTYDMSAQMSSFDNPFADYNGLEYLYEDYPYFNKILSSTSTNNYRTTYDYNNVLSIDKVLNKSAVSLEIYPNPSTDYITVKSSEIINNIKIFDALGNEVISTNQKTITINHLSKGMYLVNVSLDGERFINKKLIKN